MRRYRSVWRGIFEWAQIVAFVLCIGLVAGMTGAFVARALFFHLPL